MRNLRVRDQENEDIMFDWRLLSYWFEFSVTASNSCCKQRQMSVKFTFLGIFFSVAAKFRITRCSFYLFVEVKEEKPDKKHCEWVSFLVWRNYHFNIFKTISELLRKCDHGKKIEEGGTVEGHSGRKWSRLFLRANAHKNQIKFGKTWKIDGRFSSLVQRGCLLMFSNRSVVK